MVAVIGGGQLTAIGPKDEMLRKVLRQPASAPAAAGRNRGGWIEMMAASAWATLRRQSLEALAGAAGARRSATLEPAHGWHA